MRIEARQMYRSNGLIDDFVVYGSPADYLYFAECIGKAANSNNPIVMLTDSNITIEIARDDTEISELFTSLQNKMNDYLTMEEWKNRDILRISGNASTLKVLQNFLIDLSGRGTGYSYLSEYSETYGYSNQSPEWRLHVENT